MSAYFYQRRELPFVKRAHNALPIWAVTDGALNESRIPIDVLNWARSTDFTAKEGQFLLVPDQAGGLKGALFGLGTDSSLGGEANAFLSGKLAQLLPEGRWELALSQASEREFAFGYAMGAYRFDHFVKSSSQKAKLFVGKIDQLDDLERQLAGTFLARDLINIPANHMGPDQLEFVFKELAEHYRAKTKIIEGDDLLQQNFPLIHTVGRASDSAPRLLEMSWGKKTHPKITLVGKGVCFDTGGLDIKPSSAMGLMKKDMGGAANILGLALMIMDAKLPVQLQVLVPAVENSVSGNAFRPGDILTSRKGSTIQIDNTDAEGRLVLADALTYACEKNPELIIDMATLTGAARVALGPDLPPFYTDDERLSGELMDAGRAQHDPLWRMPLYQGYEDDIKTRISDLTNAPSGGFAGSITAALFLKHFVTDGTPWVHFDIYGWNPKQRPHAPIGGEAQGIRALYQILKHRYS